MSRGPGKVERRIAEILGDPRRSMVTIRDLIQAVFPDSLNPEASRVSVGRALRKVLARDPEWRMDETHVLVRTRRVRPDWKPREPRRGRGGEIGKWFQEYLGWTRTAQATARMILFNSPKGMLPEAAYEDRALDRLTDG